MGVLVRGVRPWRRSPGSRRGGRSRSVSSPGSPGSATASWIGRGIDPGIDQGAERHVARDPAEAVEIADAHALTPYPVSQNGESSAILTDPDLGARPE